MRAAMKKKSYTSRLGTKPIIASILLLVVFGSIFSSFYILRHRASLLHELRKRSCILADNLAYNSYIAVLSMDMTTLKTLISGLEDDEDIADITAADIDGYVIASSDSSRLGKIISLPDTSTFSFHDTWISTSDPTIKRVISPIKVEKISLSEYESDSLWPDDRADNLVSYYETIGFWILDVSLRNLHDKIVADTWFAIVFTVIMIAVGALFMISLMNSITVPIRNLAVAMGEVGKGDFYHPLLLERDDEIGDLARSFNSMIVQLRQSHQELIRWQTVLESKIELLKEHNKLLKAYEKLESLDKAKDDFISLVSHELRTPLSTILVSVEYLLEKRDMAEDKKKKYLVNILNETKRLSRLINDVLDLSKIEAGRMPFRMETVDLDDALRHVIESYKPKLEQKNIFTSYSNENVSVSVIVDKDKLVQVLENVMLNAVKFSPSGGSVRVSVEKKDTVVEIAISDSGKGIKKEDIPRVFDRFCQLENIDHHSDGTGLGMTISKYLIEEMKGSIRIESEVNKGTKVIIQLPLARDNKGSIMDSDESNLNSLESIPVSGGNYKQILIADDEISFRNILAESLKDIGIDTYEAGNGFEALDMIDHYDFDLIILDVMMPDISGLEICRYLRQNNRTRDIKIIISSAKGQHEEQKEGYSAGADVYMTKPFEIKELLTAVEELTGD